jgi:hypothetical protein
MLQPFLKHISKESSRCAELLVQLPPDLDTEGMVAATWAVVKQERLLAERSGKSFIDGLGATTLLQKISHSFVAKRPTLAQLGLPTPVPMTPRNGGGTWAADRWAAAQHCAHLRCLAAMFLCSSRTHTSLQAVCNGI